MAITSSVESKFLRTIADSWSVHALFYCALCFIGIVTLPAQASSDLLERAARCGDFYDCFNVMLQSADPRNPEAINVAAVRITEFMKPSRGNRKAARELNKSGLTEFKKGNLTEAVKLFQQASSEDPGDVEVLSNFGLALLKANRAQEARQVLSSSLAINPRRTSAWVPMADVLFEIGDTHSAMAALLLAYEFSENKEKTISFFEGKAESSERSASMYVQTLEKIYEARQSVASATASASYLGNRKELSKSEARAIILKEADAYPDFQSNPETKKFMLCIVDSMLDDLYNHISFIDESTFRSRVSGWTDGLEEDKQKADMLMLKCIGNSPALEQALKEKNARKGETTSGSSAPLLDMVDLRLDMALLNGKKVRVRGIGYYMMDMFILKESMMDMNPIFVDITQLPRDQRRELMNKCNDIMLGCRVTLHATVGVVLYQNGLLAEGIEW